MSRHAETSGALVDRHYDNFIRRVHGGLIGLGGVGGSRIYSTALLPASVMLSIAWLLMLIVAMVVHHWRGLWLLFGAPLALFWPTVMVLFAGAVADCVANHPVDAAMVCFPWAVARGNRRGARHRPGERLSGA